MWCPAGSSPEGLPWSCRQARRKGPGSRARGGQAGLGVPKILSVRKGKKRGEKPGPRLRAAPEAGNGAELCCRVSDDRGFVTVPGGRASRRATAFVDLKEFSRSRAQARGPRAALSGEEARPLLNW